MPIPTPIGPPITPTYAPNSAPPKPLPIDAPAVTASLRLSAHFSLVLSCLSVTIILPEYKRPAAVGIIPTIGILLAAAAA